MLSNFVGYGNLLHSIRFKMNNNNNSHFLPFHLVSLMSWCGDGEGVVVVTARIFQLTVLFIILCFVSNIRISRLNVVFSAHLSVLPCPSFSILLSSYTEL